jgi:hypothetical protein
LDLPISLPPLDANKGFVNPNEHVPADAIQIWHEAPQGAYISVGTERGFIAAAVAQNITHLVLVDANPQVSAYNQINVLLLRMARNREDYLQLRLHPTPNQWEAAAHAAGLSESERALLMRQLPNWKKTVSENWRFDKFQKAENFLGRFKDVNYLFNDALFERISAMAKAGRISVGTMSFGVPEYVQQLVGQLKARGIRLSILDISNAWWPNFMGAKGTAELLQGVNSIASDESRVLATSLPARPDVTYGTDLLRGRFIGGQWRYFAFTFGKIRSSEIYRKTGSFLSFARSLTELHFRAPRTSVTDPQMRVPRPLMDCFYDAVEYLSGSW